MGSFGRREFLIAIAAGAAIASPAALAQRRGGRVRLGYLTTSLASLRSPLWQPFFAAMKDRGWREGLDYVLLERESRGDPARAAALAKELVDQRVDLVLAMATASGVAASKATSRIPVVTWCGYPVEAGLAVSLSRPGRNVTGVANYAGTDVFGKFVELLRELRPGLRSIGVLWDYAPPAFPDGFVPIPAIEAAARGMGIGVRIWTVRSEKDFDAARTEIERGSYEALVVTTGGGIHNRREVTERIGELATRRRLPAITDIAGTAFFLFSSCVLAYSPNVPEILTRLADLTDRILRGADPGELPFERPSKFELAINLKAARAMRLPVPQPLLLRADRVIE